MAYIDFTNPDRLDQLSAQTERPLFSSTERTIIALAAHDGIASLASDNWLAKAKRRLFGIETPRPLADPRLESLRRVAVLAWNRRGDLPAAVVDAFLAAGYTRLHVTAIVHAANRRRIGKAGQTAMA